MNKKKTGNITKKIVFEDNESFISICGIEDSHLTILENMLKVRVYPKGNELTIEGERIGVTNADNVLRVIRSMYDKSTEITPQKIINIIKNVLEGKEEHSKDFINIKIKLPYLGRHIEMKTMSQGQYLKNMSEHDIVFSTGSAGTGKTFLSVAYGISLLCEGKVERIIITRPVVEAGESLGYLPGDFKEKISPYMRPIYDALYSLIPFDIINKFTEEGKIEVAPLAYMRGRTLSRSFIILDEAQNTTVSQMKMFLSRIGEKSKAVVTGDMSQSDLPKGIISGLSHAVKILKPIKNIGFHEFSKKDIVRHNLVSKILEAYESSKV